jgi:hypothetical protein
MFHRARRPAGWALLFVGCASNASSAHDASTSGPGFHEGQTEGGLHPADASIGARDVAANRDVGSPHPDSGTLTHSDAARAIDAGPCAQCARDWTTYPAIAQVDGVSELWVVSDIHADYISATKLLAAAKILESVPTTPSAALWGAGSATLVIVGDMIDKGPDAPDVLELVIALQASAAASGGRVVATMGNHEAEFLADPENSKASGANGLDPQLTSLGLTPDATAAGGDAIGAFIRHLPFAARVDDWFFVHGGDTGGETLAQLSSDLESGVDAMGFGAPILSATSSLLEARLQSSPPQWWDATSDPTTLLTSWTAALSAKHLVMGHQPGGLLFLIDTGMSVDVDNTGGALLHVTNVGQASVAWEEVLPSGSTKSL